MRILVLGGTIFVGRHIVESALQKGHEITLFNRNKHNPHIFPEVEKIVGNRDGELESLNGRTWDAVIDTCGYVPRIVKQSTKLLKDKTNRYVFISTVSVYKDYKENKLAESYPLATVEDKTLEKINGHTYGPLKALCERVVQEDYKADSLIIRPGLISGPYDPTNRFSYWPFRIGMGGRIIAPGNPETNIQFIDVRDLADWIILMIEWNNSGIYNATGPNYELTMQKFLSIGSEVINNDVEYVWINDKFLLEHGVEPWTDIPLWIPYSNELKGIHNISLSKALDSGLKIRSIQETFTDTLKWVKENSVDPSESFKGILSTENRILDLWSNK